MAVLKDMFKREKKNISSHVYIEVNHFYSWLRSNTSLLNMS